MSKFVAGLALGLAMPAITAIVRAAALGIRIGTDEAVAADLAKNDHLTSVK